MISYFIFLIITIILVYSFNYRTKPKFIDHKNNIPLSPELTSKDIYNLKKGQKIMTNMFKEFDRICRKYNLKYWCVGGTLIGAVRHQGWVPWDGDVDLAMVDSDYKKLQRIIQNNLPKGMWFQDKTTDPNYTSDIGKIRDLNSNYVDSKNRLWHNGVQIDIFVFTKKGDMLTISKFNGDIRNIKYNMIFPVKEVIFENLKVYIPNNTKEFLINSWGSYPPELPIIDKRKPHEGRISFKVPKWTKLMYPNFYK